MDDAICSAFDMKQLKKTCIKHKLAKCYSCFHSSPNAGYSPPDCDKRTKLGQGKGKPFFNGSPPAFKLKLGNIPKKCKYWKSSAKEHKRLEEERLVKDARRAIRKVPKRLRYKLMRPVTM